jgi:hypothetical protein
MAQRDNSRRRSDPIASSEADISEPFAERIYE